MRDLHYLQDTCLSGPNHQKIWYFTASRRTKASYLANFYKIMSHHDIVNQTNRSNSTEVVAVVIAFLEESILFAFHECPSVEYPTLPP